MAFCNKCGAKLQENVNFCTECGAPVDSQAKQTQANDFGAKIQNLNNTADTTADFEGADIEQNKIMAVLSYIGPLVLVPIFAAPKSKFARYHANQGLTLFLADLAYGIIQGILLEIFGAIFPFRLYPNLTYTRGPIYGLISTILGLAWLAFTVLAIIGIINAVKGKAKELPIIGKIKILK